MSQSFPSVDEFVEAYLAHCDQSSRCPQQGWNGLPFTGANGVQPVYQQPVCSGLQLPAAQPSSQLTPTHYATTGISSHATKAWESAGGDVYMQPYDQALQQSYAQLEQQAHWQVQQQQLQLLHQQQLAQQALLMPDLSKETTAVAASAGRPDTPKAARQGSSSRLVQQQQQQQIEANSAAHGKRNSRSKSSTRGGGRRSKQDAADDASVLLPDVEGGRLSHNLGHVSSAPPVLSEAAAAALTATAAAAAAPTSQRNISSSFSAGYDQPGNLSSSMAVLREAQATRQAQAAAAGSAQAQASLLQEAEEPDMSHLTVMQRYHARRKLAVQRMEREVEEKIAQLAMLEQENRQLKWQAHILENMLLDMDKQVELMSAEELPDASQWLTLLGMGTHATSGGTGRITRKLDRMLEGSRAVDLTGWTAQHCRSKWLAFLEALRPLVEEAEAAHVACGAAQSATSEQQPQQLLQRRPRRAAAAAAVAVIKQEAADVLGVAPLPVSAVTGSIPDIPRPTVPRSPAYGSQVQQGAGDAAGSSVQPMDGIMPANSSGSNSNAEAAAAGPAVSEHSVGSMTCSELSHGPNVEGVPPSVLSRIEELVMQNFYWLLAIMTRNPVLTYEFISVDLVEGQTPLPLQHHPLWEEAVERAELTLEQLQESSTCLEVARRCMAKVIEERQQITAAMQAGGRRPQTDAQTLAWLASDMLNQNQVDVTVERMRANVRKESVVRNLVGFYCINVISLYQLAQMCLACSPWFCMAWRVAAAAEAKLAKHLAGEAAAQQQQGAAGGHNTRSSARLAAAQR